MGVTNPYKFVLKGAVTVTAVINILLTNCKWHTKLLIGDRTPRPQYSEIPHIYVSGKLTVGVNGAKWHYKNNSNRTSKEAWWKIIEGRDSEPITTDTGGTTWPSSGDTPPISDYTMATVVIQRYDTSIKKWVEEWRVNLKTFYDDNDYSINNGTWSKNYNGIRTEIRAILVLSSTESRENAINVFLTREE